MASVSVMLVRPIAQSLARIGVPAAAFLREVGVADDAQPEDRISSEPLAKALDRIAAERDDPLALALANATPMGTLSFLDYCACTSATLGEAVTRSTRYFGLLSDRIALEIVVGKDDARIVQRHATHDSPTCLTEFASGIVANRCREIVGGEMSFRAVRFAHDAPKRRDAYDAFFGVDVEFSADADEIVFDRAWLERPVVSADPAVAEMLEARAKELVARLSAVDPFFDAARAYVAEALPDGAPSLDAAAGRLKMSARTLQRKLAERQTTWSALVDDVRREIAEQLLAKPGVLAPEVAYRLGFRDASSFYRAFRRWTGKTPGAYQASR